MNKNILLLATVIGLVFSSCSKEKDDTMVKDPVESKQVSNLYAPQTGGQGQPVGGEFTKFDFKTGKQTTSDTDWDIAFRGTTIAINGGTVTGTTDEPARTGNAGVTIKTGTFESVTTAKDLSFTQDADGSFAIPLGSDNGWYNYNPMNNVVAPIPGKILVLRTRDEHYAKVEILSYYKDNPAQPDQTSESRYYTFNYVFNPNVGETSFE